MAAVLFKGIALPFILLGRSLMFVGRTAPGRTLLVAILLESFFMLVTAVSMYVRQYKDLDEDLSVDQKKKFWTAAVLWPLAPILSICFVFLFGNVMFGHFGGKVAFFYLSIWLLLTAGIFSGCYIPLYKKDGILEQIGYS
jgi:hypothetical protein